MLSWEAASVGGLSSILKSPRRQLGELSASDVPCNRAPGPDRIEVQWREVFCISTRIRTADHGRRALDSRLARARWLSRYRLLHRQGRKDADRGEAAPAAGSPRQGRHRIYIPGSGLPAIGKSWQKEELEIYKALTLQRYLELRCIGNIVI